MTLASLKEAEQQARELLERMNFEHGWMNPEDIAPLASVFARLSAVEAERDGMRRALEAISEYRTLSPNMGAYVHGRSAAEIAVEALNPKGSEVA